jgi:transposase-like protein
MSQRRRHSHGFKLAAIARLEAGESGTALARELRLQRSMLYRWWGSYRKGGPLALREGHGRPSKVEAVEMAEARRRLAETSGLAGAQERIAELERKIGQQQQDLDFFKEALRHIRASRRPSDGPGGTASSLRSER